MLDIEKLEFKRTVLEGGRIEIKIDSLQKLFPITKEQILIGISMGYHLDKLNAFFTPESILAAKQPKKNKKENNNEGNN